MNKQFHENTAISYNKPDQWKVIYVVENKLKVIIYPIRINKKNYKKKTYESVVIKNKNKKKVKIVGYPIRKNICMMPKLTPVK